MPDDLAVDAIEQRLSGRFGRPLSYFDEIGSTNTAASQWALNGAPEGAVVVTDHQTGGRGRWGRSWFSAPGKLLQFSLILRPELDAARPGVLTAGLGVACAQAIRRTSGLPVEVKWPNDIVLGGRKLAGMLVESTLMDGRITTAVCGIGINVHLSTDDIPAELLETASSVAIEVGRSKRGSVPDRASLLAAILSEIEARYPVLIADSTALLEESTRLSSVLGHHVTIRYADGTQLSGRADRFDTDAALLVMTNGGMTKVEVGEIEQLRT